MASGNVNLLGKWYPHVTVPFIANAPMYLSTNAELAAAVHRAGGYGYLACGFDFSEKSDQIPSFDAQLSKCRSLLAITDPNAPLPIGCGFLTFNSKGFAENVVPVLAKHRVSGIWLSFPSSGEDHKEMIDAIRAEREKSNWDVKVWVQVGNVEAAKEAVEQGADVLVAQGVDAGGHQWAHGASVMVVVPEIRKLIHERGKNEEVAVVAAGGIVDGKGVVASLSLGAAHLRCVYTNADGVVMGTSFLCTTECPASDAWKNTIISSKDGVRETIKSTFHDRVQNYGFWPPLYDARAIIGPAYKDHIAGVPITENIEKHKEAMEQGDPNGRGVIYAGAGVGVIREIVSVKDLMEKTQKEARDIVGRLGSLL